MKLSKIIGISCLIALSPSAFADNDPNRSVEPISQELGITADQFRNCFSPVNPIHREGTGDQLPGQERAQQNKAILLPCLQKANPNITNKMLDTVMDKYRNVLKADQPKNDQQPADNDKPKNDKPPADNDQPKNNKPKAD